MDTSIYYSNWTISCVVIEIVYTKICAFLWPISYDRATDNADADAADSAADDVGVEAADRAADEAGVETANWAADDVRPRCRGGGQGSRLTLDSHGPV